MCLGAGSKVSHLINMPHRLTQLNHTLLRFNFPSPIFHFTHPDQPPSTRTHAGYPVGMVFEQSCECTGPLYVPLTRTHAGYPVGTVFEQSGECTGPLYVPLTDSLSPSAPSLVRVFILLSTTNACKVLTEQACQEGIDGFLVSLYPLRANGTVSVTPKGRAVEHVRTLAQFGRRGRGGNMRGVGG